MIIDKKFNHIRFYMDIVLSILVGIISGIISGIYTGIICSRYAIIEEIKRECLRVLRSIEYYDETYIRGMTSQDIQPIFLASSELLSMGQKDAGITIRNIFMQLSDEIHQKKLTPNLVDSFQLQIKLLKINKIRLLKLW
mgnify:CR=1 FL=1